MSSKLRIGIRLWHTDSLEGKKGNVMGDELIARSWQKYMLRDERVESVSLYPGRGRVEEGLDVLIHFNPNLEIEPSTRNFFYLQNAFSPEEFKGGTVGVFNDVRSRYEAYLFTSEKLRQACKAEGAVVPFATDPELFQPTEGSYNHDVSFVGNGIRTPAVNARYLAPAIPLGLVLYGNRWSAPYDAVCRGPLPARELPALHSGSKINLNAHIDQHKEMCTYNLRIYDSLACGGFVLSDPVDGMEAEFDGAVAESTGYEDTWAQIVYFLHNEDERRARVERGQRIVREKHSYAQRVQTVLSYLKAKL